MCVDGGTHTRSSSSATVSPTLEVTGVFGFRRLRCFLCKVLKVARLHFSSFLPPPGPAPFQLVSKCCSLLRLSTLNLSEQYQVQQMCLTLTPPAGEVRVFGSGRGGFSRCACGAFSAFSVLCFKARKLSASVCPSVRPSGGLFFLSESFKRKDGF